MGLRSTEFVIQEAFTGIKRNGLMAFASISTIALSLGVLGAFGLIALGANNFAAEQINKFEIAVFIQGRTRAQIEPVVKQMTDMAGVASVTVRDRGKEWSQFKRDRPDIESAGVRLDVFPFAADVKIADPSRLSAIAAKIRVLPHVDAVKEGRETLDRVMVVARAVKALSVAGVLVLLVTTIFIISNAIKLTLYARRLEIRTMQLVGATNQFIRLPLVIEGIVFGTIGALAAWLLLTICSSYAASVAQKLVFLGRFSSGLGNGQMAMAMMVVGSAIGAAGSFVSIRRFLHD